MNDGGLRDIPDAIASWPILMAEFHALFVRNLAMGALRSILSGKGSNAYAVLRRDDLTNDDLEHVAEGAKTLLAVVERIKADRQAKALLSQLDRPSWEEIIHGEDQGRDPRP
jgi:hypothetical protein